MVSVQTIFNGCLAPNAIQVSQTFTNAQFLAFATPDYDSNEGVFIGFSIFMNIPVGLGGIQVIQKDLVLPAQEFQAALSSFSVIDIPREYSEAGYVLQCAFNSSIPIESFVCYAITSSVTQESISDQVTQNAQRLRDLLTTVAGIQQDIFVMKAQIQTIYSLIATINTAVQVLLPEVATIVGVVDSIQQTLPLLESANKLQTNYLTQMVLP
jgi:hypothetical protein